MSMDSLVFGTMTIGDAITIVIGIVVWLSVWSHICVVIKISVDVKDGNFSRKFFFLSLFIPYYYNIVLFKRYISIIEFKDEE